MLKRLLLISLFLWPLAAGASSVRSMSLEEVAGHAGLIFEGRVIGRQVVAGQGKRSIHTLVTFQVLDVIKGRSPGETLTLSFMGGDTGHRSLVVSDLRLPKVGEHGIYFVADPARRFINPLVGWHQGHYLVTRDRATGRQVVRTLDGRTLYGLDVPKRAEAQALVSRSGGARGVRLTPRGVEPPMSPAAFKDGVRHLLEVRR